MKKLTCSELIRIARDLDNGIRKIEETLNTNLETPWLLGTVDSVPGIIIDEFLDDPDNITYLDNIYDIVFDFVYNINIYSKLIVTADNTTFILENDNIDKFFEFLTFCNKNNPDITVFKEK